MIPVAEGIFQKLKTNIAFFKDFTNDELITLLKLSISQNWDEENILFKEGMKGDKMYIIIKGKVRIVRNHGSNIEEIIAHLDIGSCFGEMGIIDQSPRSGTAIVEEGGATIFCVDESVLQKVGLPMMTKLYKNFSITLAERLRQTTEKYTNTSIEEKETAERFKNIIKSKLAKDGNLQKSNLKFSNFSDTFFEKGNFSDCFFLKSMFSGARFRGSSFGNANFTASQYEKTAFEQCTFDRADFTGCNFNTVIFKNCTLDKTIFSKVDYKNLSMK